MLNGQLQNVVKKLRTLKLNGSDNELVKLGFREGVVYDFGKMGHFCQFKFCSSEI